MKKVFTVMSDTDIEEAEKAIAHSTIWWVVNTKTYLFEVWWDSAKSCIADFKEMLRPIYYFFISSFALLIATILIPAWPFAQVATALILRRKLKNQVKQSKDTNERMKEKYNPKNFRFTKPKSDVEEV